jgi:hypothetical protein
MAECMCDRHWTKITTAPAPHYTGGVTGKDKSNGIYAVRRINLMMLLKQLKVAENYEACANRSDPLAHASRFFTQYLVK